MKHSDQLKGIGQLQSLVWQLLLLLGFSGVGWAVIEVFRAPTQTRAEEVVFRFPELVEIDSWEQIGSDEMHQDTEAGTKAGIESTGIESMSYSYQSAQTEQTLDVQVHYGRNGKVCMTFFEEQTIAAITAGHLLPHSIGQNGNGFYQFSSHEEGAYLQAIVDARGPSVVGQQQFIQNRYKYFLKPASLVRWVLGREGASGDHRCFSTRLSLQGTQKSSMTHLASLELVWPQWYRWARSQLE